MKTVSEKKLPQLGASDELPVYGSPPSHPPMLGRVSVGETRPSLKVLSDALASDSTASEHSRDE
jgi:hypothetical protein